MQNMLLEFNSQTYVNTNTQFDNDNACCIYIENQIHSNLLQHLSIYRRDVQNTCKIVAKDTKHQNIYRRKVLVFLQ